MSVLKTGRDRGSGVLKLYGDRNTGTNYLTRLVELNLDISLLPGVVPAWVASLQRLMPGHESLKDAYDLMTRRRTLGWKHAAAPPVAFVRASSACSPGLRFVTLTKNPYSWLLSLFHRPYASLSAPRTDLFKFALRPFETPRREGLCRLTSRTPIEIWNAKNKSYLELAGGVPTRHVRYEDLVLNPRATLSDLCSSLAIEPRRVDFVNVEESTKGDHATYANYRQRTLTEQWRNALDRETVALVNEQLDGDVMSRFGYERLRSL